MTLSNTLATERFIPEYRAVYFIQDDPTEHVVLVYGHTPYAAGKRFVDRLKTMKLDPNKVSLDQFYPTGETITLSHLASVA